jgi:hypothetical protein
MSIDAPGCDPVIRTAAGDAIEAILAEVPALIAAAEAQWEAQPRYAGASVSGKALGAEGRPRGKHGDTSAPRGARPLAQAVAASASPPRTEPPATPLSGDQPRTPNPSVGEASPPADAPVFPAAAPLSGAVPAAARPARSVAAPRKGAPSGQLSLFGDA